MGLMHVDMYLEKTDNLGYGPVKRRERNIEVLEKRTSFRYVLIVNDECTLKMH